MNKIFKAIWNDVTQTFVTTSELQTSRGKRTKSVAAVALTGLILLTTGGGVIQLLRMLNPE